MTTSRQRHARAKKIFAEACSKTPSDRGAYVQEECSSDEELFREVESLLSFHDGAATEIDPDPVTAPATWLLRAPRPVEPTPVSGNSSTRLTGRFNPGEIFARRYRIVSLLGMGGMGEVYQAHDEVLDAPVALKFISEISDERREGLLNEVRLARLVTHPSVCRVYDVDRVGQEYFITMEYVDGEDLSSLLRRVGRFPGDKLLELAHQLCAGLAAAHAKGVLHQDLKPANILVDGEGKVRITDFGIATTVEHSKSGKLLGTPAYMAPERLAGQAPSAQSDIYALGLVLYEMAVGQPAFRAATPFEYATLHRGVAPERPSELVTDLDPRVEAVILACLEKDPRARPASALEVVAALPGGDPLKMAMEAGETPSPELLAKIRGEDEGIRPAVAGGWLALLAALLAAVFWTADPAYQLPTDELKAPQALADRAREIIADLGHENPSYDDFAMPEDLPSGRAWGLFPYEGRDRRRFVFFWYRQSPFPLVPSDTWRLVYDSPRVGFEDPPNIDEGMIQIELDGQGRLIMFYVIPPILEQLQPPVHESGPDWNRALRAAGFDPAEVRPAEEGPRRLPRIHVDERRAWTGADPRALVDGGEDGDEGPRVHIDAGAYRGRVVYVSAWPHDPDEVEELSLNLFETLAQKFFLEIGLVLVVVVAMVVARVNLRRGRGDLRVARNLAFGVVAAKVVFWLLAASHVPIFDAELVSFQVSLGMALVEALMVWVLYIALEPTVRSSWPRTLLAWSRAMRSRWRDPLVGQSLLVGAAVGALWALLRAGDALLFRRLGLTPLLDPGFQLEVALNPRLPFANLLTEALYAIYFGVTWLFVLALCRVAVKRADAAIAAFFVLMAVFEMFTAGHPELFNLTSGLLVAVAATWTLVRFGLLTFIVALFVESTLAGSPITSDLSAWFSGAGLLALLVPVVLAAFGAHSALAGRALFGDWMAAEPARL